MKPLVRGDYVLATKYADGDPCDHFHVGFFREMLGDRFLVDDGKGQLARANGFRRCERISARVGHALCAAMPIIGDRSGKSVWYWRHHVGALEQLVSANNAICVKPEKELKT
jgi:hypothetical protein